MKLYIASRFKNKQWIRNFANRLPPTYDVVSTWHDIENAADSDRIAAVKRDLAEIEAADAVLLVTHDCEQTPGGLHFEAGYAHAKGKALFIVGPRVNIFCDLAERYDYGILKADAVTDSLTPNQRFVAWLVAEGQFDLAQDVAANGAEPAA